MYCIPLRCCLLFLFIYLLIFVFIYLTKSNYFKIFKDGKEYQTSEIWIRNAIVRLRRARLRISIMEIKAHRKSPTIDKRPPVIPDESITIFVLFCWRLSRTSADGWKYYWSDIHFAIDSTKISDHHLTRYDIALI